MDLQKFCANENDPRVQFHKPFEIGEHTCATNGHVILFFPTDDVRYERISRQSFETPILRMLDKIRSCKEWKPVPSIKMPLKNDCRQCQGKGKNYICPECLGDGEIEFDNKFSCYNVTCRTCDGDGNVMKTCHVCYGLGLSYEKEYFVTFGDLDINAIYFDTVVQNLPNAEWCKNENMICLKSGELLAAIMCLKKGHGYEAIQ